MKFSTRVDTDLSAAELYVLISDFDRIERRLTRHGAELSRKEPGQAAGPGNGWAIRFHLHGKARELTLDVARFDPPEALSFAGGSDSYEMRVDLNVVALAPRRARLIFALDLSPRTTRARLVLRTARLGKARLDRGFATRIERFVEDLRRD